MSQFDKLDIVIRHKGEAVVAGIPALGLYARGSDIEAAIAMLETKKKALMADLDEAGELETIDISGRAATLAPATAVKRKDDLGGFAIKTIIVLAAVVAAFTLSGVLVVSRVERSVQNIVNEVKNVRVGGQQFWTKMEAELDRMASAEQDLPEAKKQKVLADIRAIGAKWRPFIVEIQGALADKNGAGR